MFGTIRDEKKGKKKKEKKRKENTCYSILLCMHCVPTFGKLFALHIDHQLNSLFNVKTLTSKLKRIRQVKKKMGKNDQVGIYS